MTPGFLTAPGPWIIDRILFLRPFGRVPARPLQVLVALGADPHDLVLVFFELTIGSLFLVHVGTEKLLEKNEFDDDSSAAASPASHIP
jgi:hypothetical protein